VVKWHGRKGDGEEIKMSATLCIAALALSLRDAPVPVAISLMEYAGVLKFCDDNGHSLYVYDRDPAGSSVCVGQCASMWPPVAAPQDARRIGDWTPTRRTDGSSQWAYKGKPVYTFSGDTAAGQANGASMGGVWRLLTP
jgi:predicted lipoprotein with Yx(FWY)xxD motif